MKKILFYFVSLFLRAKLVALSNVNELELKAQGRD